MDLGGRAEIDASKSRQDVTARYSRSCMLVREMSAFARMNLGGTAGDRFCPILTWDRGFFIAHSAG